MLQLRLDHVFDMNVSFGAETRVADGPLRRMRAFLPVTGGTVSGPRLSGEIVAGSGGDWPRIEAGSVVLDGRWIIRAADGTNIMLKMSGYLNAPVSGAWRGDGATFAEPVLHVAPFFEAPGGAHEWLTRTVFVGKADRKLTGSSFRIHAVM